MKVKIGFVIYSLTHGGAERVMATLCNYFSKNYEVVLITLIEKERFYAIDSSVELRQLNDSPRQSANPILALYHNYLDLRKLKRIIEKNQVNVLISFTTSANVLSILAAKQAKIPCIISERNNGANAPINGFWKFARNRFYKLADYLVVQTEGNKQFYASIVTKSKIKIIQNPISPTINTTPSDDIKSQTRLHILTVGRLNDNKAQNVSLQALSLLKDLDWEFAIVGDGAKRDDLQQLSVELDIADRVHFTGAVKNVGHYYQMADIFVFTSRSEGFPNALMEANYAGVPSISTNCDFGPSEIITDGEDGFLIPVDDVQALQEKLRLLLTDEALRNRFSKNAHNRSSRFELKKIAASWEDLIHSLLKV